MGPDTGHSGAGSYAPPRQKGWGRASYLTGRESHSCLQSYLWLARAPA